MNFLVPAIIHLTTCNDNKLLLFRRNFPSTSVAKPGRRKTAGLITSKPSTMYFKKVGATRPIRATGTLPRSKPRDSKCTPFYFVFNKVFQM